MARQCAPGLFADRWRIRRDGKLLFADDLRFDWADAELLGRPAVLAGAAAMATILFVTDEPARHLDPLRAIIGDAAAQRLERQAPCANGSPTSGAALRRDPHPGARLLLDGAALPQFWQI